MKKTSIMLIIAFAIGAMSGYWYRGQVEIAREQAAIHEFMTSPPHALALAPPSTVPAPLTGGWKPAPRSK